MEDTQNNQGNNQNNGKTEHLKPHQWKPGVSGNPGGRPKGLMRKIREATKDGEVLKDFWLEVMAGKIKGASASDKLTASRLLAEHGFGKPVQPVSGPDGGPLEVTWNLKTLSDEELFNLDRLANKATVPSRN